MTATTITPSSLWQGTLVEGSRWTREQLKVLAEVGITNPEHVAIATVLRTPRFNRENWTMPPRPVEHVVPRLAVTRDGRRAKIITPAGKVDWLEVAHRG